MTRVNSILFYKVLDSLSTWINGYVTGSLLNAILNLINYDEIEPWFT